MAPDAACRGRRPASCAKEEEHDTRIDVASARAHHHAARRGECQGALHGHGENNPKEAKERRFAHTLAHVLDRGHAGNAFARLALVAPPKLLGELRENLGRGLQTASVAEDPKDYTHCGVEELMRLLRSELPV